MKILRMGLFVLPMFVCGKALAGDFEFSHSINVRGYYGVMDTHKKASLNNNLPNRLVNRNDAKLKGEYTTDNGYKFGLYNDSSLIFRQHDSRYNHDGEWRFYTHGMLDTPEYGRVYAGESYNIAYQFHKGAKDSGPLGISDSNMAYFLSNPNWKNGKKSVSYYTFNSTAMMSDGRAFKVSYVTPQIYNTLVGFTYTPDSPSRRGNISRYNNYTHDDAYVAAIHNEWEFDFADVYTSAGYGLFNRTDKELSLGVTLVRGGWTVAAGYKKSYVDGNKNPMTTVTTDSRRPAFFDNYRESQAWDASVGYEIGPLKTSISYLHTKADNTSNKDDLVVLSNTYSVNKMVDVYAIGGYLNSRGINKQDINNNKGYAAIMGIGLNF